jgi:hypothetical protein
MTPAKGILEIFGCDPPITGQNVLKIITYDLPIISPENQDLGKL